MNAINKPHLKNKGPAQSMTGMCFDNSYARLPGAFYKRCDPDSVANPKLIALNRPLAVDLGMDDPDLLDDHGLLSDLFSGNRLPMGAEPIATAFAGHQFGEFVHELGDEQTLLVGEVIDRCQQRKDIQLNGCGRTPFARSGDGRSPLAAAIREYLLSEAMHALGVPTTRALALTTTGEFASLDNPQPATVMARVTSCHIRIGTFEYFARSQQQGALRALADYTIARLCPELMTRPDPYLSLLRWAVDRQAKLVAHWVNIGFIHGEMDTDKVSLAGETSDYGASAFLDHYDPDALFSASDLTGRYAYNNQAFAAQWNLSRLAEALVGLLHGSKARAVAEASRAVKEFRPRYEDYLLDLTRARLGLDGAMPEDRQLIRDLRQLLAQHKIDYHSFFHKLADDIDGGGITAALFGSEAGRYLDWYRHWHLRLTLTGRSSEQCFQAMMAANPLVVPRNHVIERVIERALDQDFSEFYGFLNAVRSPFEEPDDPTYCHPSEDNPALSR
ncbi:MAG: protein adenylyltransferase SelO family protein [Marinobacter sp.]|uniref:protein adenylyltransferase SelO n=1 Tax=Marinobacter sp. TaxID=50741 RepID=UPI0039749291